MLRQLLPPVATVLLLGACGMFESSDQPSGPATTVRRFAGSAVGDEPQAVVAARNVLANGGTAVDAAVAMYFTLAVTLPSSASLGSGGTCVVFQPDTGEVEALDFLARSPGSLPASADRPSAVPGSAMGFWTLHARYGRLPWPQLVAPAERLAQFGVRASRVLIGDMAPVAAPLLDDPESRRIFADATGRPIGEGASFVQPDLARTLSAIRTAGATELYRGALARALVRGAAAAGGSLDLADLQSFKAEWVSTVQVKFGSHIVHFAPPPAAAGMVEAQMFAMLDQRGRFDNADPVEKLHVLAEAGMRSFADRARWMRDDFTATEPLSALLSAATIERLMRNFDWQKHTPPGAFAPPPVARPENPSATSFLTLDREGSAVVCALTMNNNFGTGRIARGTGIVLAAVPSAQGRGPSSLGPMLVMNPSSKQFFFGAGASGGVAAPTALINVAARVLLEGEETDAAMHARRIHHGGAPDITYYEPGISRDDVMALTRRGHNVAATPVIGIVNAVYCKDGMPRRPETCAALADPRGSGIALNVGQ